MRHTDFTLIDQLRMTDREIRRRQELLSLLEEDINILLELRPVVANQVDSLVEEFYVGQVEIPEISRLIGDAETLSRLKNYMRLYILSLFEGDYGRDYVLSRLRIGQVHKRIGVPPKLYVAAVRRLMNLLRETIIGLGQKDCSRCERQLDCLEKILFFDLELVFDTYIHSLMDELARGRDEVEEYASSLEEIVAKRTEELSVLARKDGLTELLNQRSFYEELRREIARSTRHGSSLTLLYIDLDGFKQVNDTQGHKRGDDILIGVAGVMGQVLRTEDIPARYGGDEFCVILPRATENMGHQVADRLIARFEETLGNSGVTFSIGIATMDPSNLVDGDALVKMADKAMYRSKKMPGHAVTLASDVE